MKQSTKKTPAAATGAATKSAGAKRAAAKKAAAKEAADDESSKPTAKSATKTAAKVHADVDTKPATEPGKPANGTDANEQPVVTLRLYVAGQTPKSLAALANLKKVCDEYLATKYKVELEIIDLFEKPQLAQADQILAIPTLVRKLPSPIKKIIGDLSNRDRLLLGLDIRDSD